MLHSILIRSTKAIGEKWNVARTEEFSCSSEVFYDIGKSPCHRLYSLYGGNALVRGAEPFSRALHKNQLVYIYICNRRGSISRFGWRTVSLLFIY